jgi:hypothetical protein
MLEGATAHHNGPPGLSQHFSLAVDISSFPLFGPVYIVCSLYTHFLHCIVRMGMQLASFCTPVPHNRMLHTRIHDPLRKEHAL